MCGRYALPVEPKDLPAEFGKQNLEVDEELDSNLATHHRYNIGPTQYAPVYMMRLAPKTQEKYSNQCKHILRYMRWGMVPKWIKAKSQMKSGIPTFNARYEKIGQNRLWVTSVNQRCVIPILGYYEWQKQKQSSGGIRKQPYYITRKDGKLMFLAGLYSRSIIDGEEVFSYTIITWNAPKCLGWLHDRMPVVLDPETDDFSKWLDPTGGKKHWADVKDFLKIYDGRTNKLQWYRVSQDVGNMKNEDSKFVKPIPKGSGIAGMLRKKPVKVKEENLYEPVKKELRDEKSTIKVKREVVKSKVKQEPEVKQEPGIKKELKVKKAPKVKQEPTIKKERSPRKRKLGTIDAWLSPKKRNI